MIRLRDYPFDRVQEKPLRSVPRYAATWACVDIWLYPARPMRRAVLA
jgi:hypothetical protein